VLIDTGPLVAILYEKEEHHERCVQQMKELPATVRSCWPVITEAAYLLRASPAGVHTLLSRVELGRVEILPLTSGDAPSISAILKRYSDQGFDFADACLMHLAEREGIEYVFTLDRRHFSVYRPPSGRALVLLP
jgi:predicted nucleic acid-binding protein